MVIRPLKSIMENKMDRPIGAHARVVDTKNFRTGYIFGVWVLWHNGERDNLWMMKWPAPHLHCFDLQDVALNGRTK